MTAKRAASRRPVAWFSPVGPLLLAAVILAGCSSRSTNPQPPSAALAARTPAPAAPEDICTSPVRPAGAIEIVDRFGKWTLGTRSLSKGADPHDAFAPVAAGSLGNLRNTNVYVVTHGWAPGWNSAVLRSSSKLRWWSTAAGVDPTSYGPCNPARQGCLWPSDFAWTASSVTYNGKPFVISESGLLPAIVANDPKTLVLAYSWLDDSATDPGDFVHLQCAFISESYTNLNGLRLASGLRTILGDSFWDGRNNSLHLIGHSHGSKVATTAALALQKLGHQVDQLTILDSPESYLVREVGAANFNWLYLSEMTIRTNPMKGQANQIFVDNYASEFDFPYTDFGNLGGVVDVTLQPVTLYPDDSQVADDHTYAATWYAGAAAVGRKLQPRVLVGLDWSPVLQPANTAKLAHLYKQTWPQVTAAGQVQLAARSPSPGSSFSLPGIDFYFARATGTATWNQNSQQLQFAAGGDGVFSVDYFCQSGSGFEGIAFDIHLNNTATTKSQLVVELGGSRYMVIDGDPNINDATVSFNAGNEYFQLDFRSSTPALDPGAAGSDAGAQPWIVLDTFRCIDLSDSAASPSAKVGSSGPELVLLAQGPRALQVLPRPHQLRDLPDVSDVVQRPLVQHLREGDLACLPVKRPPIPGRRR
jgi:hypothetical protein